MASAPPGLSLERDWIEQGHAPVVGLDEAGRGAWAGPVVAGAVALPLDRPDLLDLLADVRDSKLLTPHQREDLFPVIEKAAAGVATGEASAGEIDRFGIIGATRLAMSRAVEQLSMEPGALLIDGRGLRLSGINVPQKLIVRGEQASLSIAAASILAKVTRDHQMIAYETEFPGYGFAHHKGYGTPEHQRALRALGPCTIHRRTFEPIRVRLLESADEASP